MYSRFIRPVQPSPNQLFNPYMVPVNPIRTTDFTRIVTQERNQHLNIQEVKLPIDERKRRSTVILEEQQMLRKKVNNR